MVSLGRVGGMWFSSTCESTGIQNGKDCRMIKVWYGHGCTSRTVSNVLYTNHNALVPACVFMYICVRESLHVCVCVYVLMEGLCVCMYMGGCRQMDICTHHPV